VGPFKNVEDSILELVTSTVILNLMDINSHYPLQSTRVKIKGPDGSVILTRIGGLIPGESDLHQLVLGKLQDRWGETFVADADGRVVLPLVTGMTYSIEFAHRDYYWYQADVYVDKSQSEFDVLLSDIGSKVRNEQVKPKTELRRKQ
jgi:hypothetical protein